MEDFGSLVFILAAVLWSVLSGLFGRKGKGRPSPRAPGPRPPASQRAPGPGDTAPVPPPSRSTGSEEASVLVPDDLWAILTGERRPPAAPPRERPEPEPEFEEEWAPEPVPTADEEAVLRGPPTFETPASLEEIPEERPFPQVVSLETPPPPPAIRHDAFHLRLAQREAAEAGRPTSTPSRRVGLGGRRQLRRAVILGEVLGLPKGLEESS